MLPRLSPSLVPPLRSGQRRRRDVMGGVVGRGRLPAAADEHRLLLLLLLLELLGEEDRHRRRGVLFEGGGGGRGGGGVDGASVLLLGRHRRSLLRALLHGHGPELIAIAIPLRLSIKGDPDDASSY